MAERRFTVRLDAEMNINQVKSAVQNMQTEISKINLPQDIGSKLTGTFDKLTGEIEKFQAISAKGIGSSKDFSQLERSGDKILQLYAQLRNQVQGLGNLSDSQLSKMIPQSALNNIKKASEAYKTYTSTIEKNAGALEKQRGKVEGARAEITRLEQSIRRTENMKIVASPKDLTELKNSTVQAKNELDGLEAEAKQAQTKIEELTAKLKHPEKSKQIATLQQQLASLGPQIEQARNKYNSLNNQFNNTTTISKQSRELENLHGQLVTAQANFDNLNNELNELKSVDSTALTNLVSALNQISGINIDQTTTSLEQIQQVIANLSQGEINQLKASFAQAGQQVNGARGQFDQFNQEIDQTRGKVNQLDSQMGEVDMLKSRISYFFGLTNSVYLLRRALTSAMETVKELDQTMTEAAVVTDFSVSDMWEKLPQYTKEASALGATVNDLYGATTLYYQQGLKTNEAMELGIETMKMARIAGMEASEATEAMTAALRGFNMELTEASATKVNDVYSQLAAITAADTSQIATAMEKTASIAASANMEFETTAALLAQIIETTQEAPETAGTAMKTIIARFSEVKELKNQGKTKGEDTEGEEIDVNKIQTALRTVGISMDGFFQGTEGLDSVLLKLAEKWDTLDFQTQRYIATMAAGSRQQSRFIAMMSDYKRTVQLVGEANDSAGASQKQFEKTLDSIKAKLNQLKNEWDRFTMGIADNELIKKGVDLLTKVLEKINNTTDAISGESGLLKSIVNLGIAFGGLKLGGMALTKGLSFFLGIGGNGKENINNDIEHSTRMKQAEIEHKKELLYQAEEHKTRLRYLAEEQKAVLHATQAEQTAAIQGEYTEKATALEGEYIEAMTAAEGEGAEAMAAVEAEYQEKFASLESEYIKRQAVLDTQILEQELAINTAYAEQTMAVNGEIAELEAAIAGETSEAAAGATGEAVESAVGSANGIMGFFKNKGKGIGNFFKKNGKAIGWIAAITISIAAIDGLVTAVNKVVDNMNYTIEERLEDITASQEIAQQGLEKTTSELKNFSKARRDIQDTTRALKDMTRGSAEWVSSIHEIRTQMKSILDSYPELKEYTEIINGVSVLTEEGWEKYEKKLVETQLLQQATVEALQAQATILSSYQAAENLNLNTSSISQEEQQKIKNAQTTGGWIGGVGGGAAGAIAGAKLLGGLGSFAGPVGTVIGAVVGALAGLVVGNLIGNSGVEEGVSLDTINDVALKASKYTLQNGEAFSAENATAEEIERFLIDAGIEEGSEDFEELRNYISENGKEFDEHSRELKLNEAELNAFGEAVGAARAGVLGLDEKESEAYQELFGLMTQEEYRYEYEKVKASITDEYLKSEKGRKAVAEAAGYYFDEISKNFFYSRESMEKVDEEKDFDLEQQRAILAANKTMTKIMGRVDSVFANFGEIYSIDKDIAGMAISHSKDDPTLQKLSYNQLSKIEALSKIPIDILDDYNYTDKVEQVMAFQKDSNDTDYGLRVSYKYNNITSNVSGSDDPNAGDGYGNIAISTKGTKTSIVDKNMAAAWLSNNQDEIDRIITNELDSMKKTTTSASGSSTEYYERDGNEETFTISDVDFYKAIAEKTELPLEMIQSYDKNKNLADYFNVDEANAEMAAIQQYVEDMPFLKTVPAEIAELFGQKVTYIIDSYELGEYESKFKTVLNGIFDGVAAKNQAQLANIITSLDFTSLTELNGFAAILEEMEGVTQDAKAEFEAFVEELKEAGIAYADIDLEKLISQMEEVQKLVKKLNDLKVDESIFFTKEELNTMLNADLDRDEFVSTVDGYLYLGKNMEELEQTLRESNKILLGLQTDALRKKVETAEFINNDSELLKKDWATTATWTDKQINEALDGMAQAALNAYNKKNKTNYTLNQVNKDIWDEMIKGTPLQGYGIDWAQQWMGTDKYGKEKSLEWSKQDEGVQVLLRNWLAEIGDSVINYAGDSGYKAQYEEGLRDVTEQELSLKDPEEIYKYWWNSRIGRDEQGQKISEGLLDQRLSEDDQAASIFTQWQDNLTDLPANFRSATVAQKAMALEVSDLQQELKALITTTKEHIKTLRKGPEAGQAYYQSLNSLTMAAKSLFGDWVDTKYIEDIIPYLEDLAAGGERAAKAFEQMAKAAKRAFLTTVQQKFGWTALEMGEFDIVFDKLLEELKNNPTGSIDIDDFYVRMRNTGLIKELHYGEFIHGLQETGYFTGLNDDEYYLGVNEDGQHIYDWEADPSKGGVYADDILFSVGTDSLFSELFGTGEYEFENPYDELYNDIADINALLREREKLERQYQRLIERTNLSSEQLTKNRQGQLENYEEERQQRIVMLANRKVQMENLVEKNSQYSEYAYLDENTGKVKIDYEKIATLEDGVDQEFATGLTDFISKMEEQNKLIEEEEDALYSIEEGIWEVANQGKDEYFDLEQQVIDALIQERQNEIDKLSEINNSINDTNSKILDRIQQTIDEQRQNRENEKTATEIEEKQQRLLYLQQDSSGGNALEILELQKEIEESQEDYTDTLIDQKISELQKQNDEAAEQRQEQIDLMNRQLEQDKSNGELAKEAQSILSKAFGESGTLDKDSSLFKLLWKGDNVDSLSSLAQLDWVNDITSAYIQAASWSQMGAFNSLHRIGQEVRFTNANGEPVTGTINEEGDVVTTSGAVYQGKSISISGYTKDSEGNYLPNWTSSQTRSQANEAGQTKETEGTPGSENNKNIQRYLNEYLRFTGTAPLVVDGIIGKEELEAYKAFTSDYGRPLDQGIQDSELEAAVGHWIDMVKDVLTELALNRVSLGFPPEPGREFDINSRGIIQAISGEKYLNTTARKAIIDELETSGLWNGLDPTAQRIFQYKEGGLADFTGPAWLDGTKSRPEYILNADQTKAFFTLVDVLSSLREPSVQNTQNTGDNNYDIDINVESIGSDYDVEQISRKIEEMIVSSSRYRNNNVL